MNPLYFLKSELCLILSLHFTYLSVHGQVGDEPVEHSLEVLTQKFVGLVEAKQFAFVNIRNFLVHQVQNSARSGNNEMNLKIEL